MTPPRRFAPAADLNRAVPFPDPGTDMPRNPGPGHPGRSDGLHWPQEEPARHRPDWRERFALGADLALIGILVTVAALPVLTAPAAVASGSAAVRHRYHQGTLPPVRPLLRLFRRTLLPGLPVLVLTAAILIDLIAVGRGWVPGGQPLFVLTAAAAGFVAGLGTLVLVAVGRDPELPWRDAGHWAIERPAAAGGTALAGALAFFLALTVPATLPLVVGFHLFAVHVITDRLATD
ncbi:hypothetical protein [Actinoplanes sp. NBRC 101535]|uniref:hypothetical protein n=1 Tax=Actinoplanes sp. NBRC 101535 TaxID=3032196 RepID=UPI0024A2D768|nr:hypothetical protein [Actinoplanes sp. NBRC 101535]GLX99993.1 hypothetical protein Acsp01_03730 [Actinoplanes sp. NBRC 101535]